jgi:Flp pilus assembly protein TadD
LRPRLLIALPMAACMLAGGPGCRTSRSGPYTPQTEAQRDSLKAQRLTQEAATIMEKDAAKAEKLLREALTADLYHGPAHNNLGVIYLKRGDLYSAASEFEWGRKLMPGHPDPRMNLALTLERAGRVGEAISAYTSALEVYPDHIATMQALARLQIKSGRTDANTPRYIREIALRGENDRWRDWARQRLEGE